MLCSVKKCPICESQKRKGMRMGAEKTAVLPTVQNNNTLDVDITATAPDVTLPNNNILGVGITATALDVDLPNNNVLCTGITAVEPDANVGITATAPEEGTATGITSATVLEGISSMDMGVL